MARRNKINKEIRPTFFKVLIGDFSNQLRIPSAFVKNFNGKSLGRCIVKSPTGGCWIVHVEETEKGLYFGNGWQDFVKDHCLEMGDFTVFKYYGKSEFSVKIYDKTCCEKIIYLRSKNGNGNGNETSLIITPHCKHLDTSGSSRPEKKPEEVSNAITSSSLTFNSDNSWFILRWTYYRKYFATIPVQLAREKKLLTEKVVEIIDPAGKIWVVGLFKYTYDGRLYMRGEIWSHFWKENEIKIGDTVIFEFTKPTAAMQVHIFRGTSLDLGSIGSRRRNSIVVNNATVCHQV